MRSWDVIAVLVAVAIVASGAIIASLKTMEHVTARIEEIHSEPEHHEQYEPPIMPEIPQDNPPEPEYGEPRCSSIAEWVLVDNGKQKNCSILKTHKECEKNAIMIFEGSCVNDSCMAIETDVRPCDHCRTVKGFWTESDAICLQNPESNVVTLRCGADNEENKCCCFIPAHTYLFDSPKHIGNVEIRYKTGWGYRCSSNVNAYVIDENGNKTLVTTLPGVGHKMLMASLDLSKYGKIKGIVLDEGGECYLDRSGLIIEILPR